MSTKLHTTLIFRFIVDGELLEQSDRDLVLILEAFIEIHNGVGIVRYRACLLSVAGGDGGRFRAWTVNQKLVQP